VQPVVAKRYTYQVRPLGLVHECSVIEHVVQNEKRMGWTLISTYVDPSSSVVYGIFETWTKVKSYV
jgi:hypothetical protein